MSPVEDDLRVSIQPTNLVESVGLENPDDPGQVVVDGTTMQPENIVIPRSPYALQGPPGPAGPAGPPGNGVPVIQREILNSTQIGLKRVDLVYAPIGGIIILTPAGGPPQRLNIEYAYDGVNNRVVWNGYGLDGILEENETIDLWYQRN